jgi:CheY-like chemotaxis protein
MRRDPSIGRVAEDSRADLLRPPPHGAALELMTHTSFDVCLIDYCLGDRDGLTLIAEALKWGCRAPAILLTGVADRNLDEMAMSVGAGDYLVKGQITPESLERSIRHTLERTRMLQAMRESDEQFRLLLDGLGEHAILLLTPTGQVGSWNSANSYASAHLSASRPELGAVIPSG